MTGRAALVTGASRGFGREVALRFARGGWNVAINYERSAAKADAVAREAAALGVEAFAVRGDVGDPGCHEGLIRAPLDRWGRLDGLVNNAGISDSRAFRTLSSERWDRVLAVNLLGPIGLIRRAAAAMAPGASVVNVCSMCGVWGCGGAPAYSASKAALAGLAPGLAWELAAKGIRINGVAPGYMPTDMGRSLPGPMEQARSQHAMKRLADPAGSAEFVFRLAAMLRVTGQLFVLDGRIR